MTIDPTYSLFTPTLIVVSAVFPALATVVVGLRFYVKRIKRQDLYWDDWTILASLALCWGISLSLWIMAPRIGITRVEIPPREAALQTFKFFWINEIPFSIALGLVKISVLLFYARVFTTTILRKVAWTLIIIIAMWSIAILLVSIFKTNPISGIWSHPEDSYVIDDAAYAIAVASMSLGFDVIILSMPLFVIHSLQMPLLRKLAVMMIFWLGALCCVAAGARLHLLNKSIHSVTDNPNAYANLTKAFVWAELEPNASVMAASLPMLRPLFSGDESGLGSWFSVWRTRVSSLFSRRSTQKSGSSSIGTFGGSVGRSSQGYTQTKSDTESTRELNRENEISVRHDIELGHYDISDRK
ncbi:hypothetical protein K504DRAFT_73421 [Pleomassaria siparia CBS 279.74]|uniref:Rhodopsin domain-containing protein n=1 Tax=Pleomassaria siparia CBS 279.74 TaxID=1314801 RepID=A0A6G1K0S1_9PLEO|nr:hypothetical protein K504DRAFT_73421 [Pleomassaria siparia CBS 279.74]